MERALAPKEIKVLEDYVNAIVSEDVHVAERNSNLRKS